MDDERARAGHNSQDDFAAKRADIEERIAAFMQGADVWSGRAELDEALAARANDFLTGAKKLLKEAEDARKAEKDPHLKAAAAVDADWASVKSRIDKICDVVRPLLDRFLKAKAQREAEARRKAEEATRRAAEAARAAQADAEAAQSVSARIEAEERAAAHARAAEAAEAEAAKHAGPVRAESATGLANRRGLKTVRRARITSLAQALAHYRDRTELAALIEQMANAELRAAPTIRGAKQIPTIPGIEWIESEELAA